VCSGGYAAAVGWLGSGKRSRFDRQQAKRDQEANQSSRTERALKLPPHSALTQKELEMFELQETNVSNVREAVERVHTMNRRRKKQNNRPEENDDDDEGSKQNSTRTFTSRKWKATGDLFRANSIVSRHLERVLSSLGP
jgi:hypothetical protein